MRAASELLGSGPLGRIGLREIAAHAGVSVGTVTYHFDSVDEILDLAFAQEVTSYYIRLEQEVRATDDPVEALRLLARATFNEATARHWQLWLHNLQGRNVGSTVGGQTDRYEQWDLMIADLLRRGADAGVLRCDDVDQGVALLVALADGLSLRHLRGGLGSEQAERLFTRAVGTILAIPALADLDHGESGHRRVDSQRPRPSSTP